MLVPSRMPKTVSRVIIEQIPMGVNDPSQLKHAQIIRSVVEKSYQELIMYIRYLKISPKYDHQLRSSTLVATLIKSKGLNVST